MKCGLGSRMEEHGPPLGLLPSSSFDISGPQKVHACWALQACFSDALSGTALHRPHPDARQFLVTPACYDAVVLGSNHLLAQAPVTQ